MKPLKAEHISIRPWKTGDEESIVQYANNRKVSINLRDRFPYPYTLKDAEWWVEFASQESPITNVAIVLDSHIIGGIGLTMGTDIFRRSAELGYWLGEPFWGRGLMVEAVKLITEYAFEKLDLVRIHAGVFEWNPASARVLEKAGYTLESRMQKAAFKDGKIIDQLMYVMVK